MSRFVQAKRISRRVFCGGIALAVLGMGCNSGSSRLLLGGTPKRVDFGDAPSDAGGASNDGPATSGDLGSDGFAPSCAGAERFNVGRASSFVLGDAQRFQPMDMRYTVFICRDEGGLYALDATCAGGGCTVDFQSSSLPTPFSCSCDSTTYDYNGANPSSPTAQPLRHVALCVDESGQVTVDPTTDVAAATRAPVL